MRRWAFVLSLTISFTVILTAGIATAAPLSSASNVHGGYTANTSACSQCHSTHAAIGKNLIQNLAAGNNDVYATCMYCHGMGQQSKYNVEDGAIETGTATYAASGGGFVRMVTAEGSTPTYASVYSQHNVNEVTGTTVWVPGYDTAAPSHMELTCASCHDPHNTANISRALRVNVNGVDISATPPDLTITNELADESIAYLSGWNDFCGACHQDFYQTAAGSGDTDSGAYSTKKRHRVGMDPAGYPGVNAGSWVYASLSQPSSKLPLQSVDSSAANEQVMCLTCHYAHGTKAYSSITFNRTDGTTSNSSTLLRLDERGVCEACHNK